MKEILQLIFWGMSGYAVYHFVGFWGVFGLILLILAINIIVLDEEEKAKKL